MNCRKNIILGLVSCVVAIILTACNKPSEQSTEMTLSSQQEHNWKEENFVSGDQLENSSLHTANYKKIEFTEPKNTVANSVQQIANGEYFFILDSFYTSSDTIYQFQRIGLEETSEKITISPTKWNIANGTIMSMDVLNPEQCVFFVASYDATEPDKRQIAEHYYVIYTDYLGNEIRRVDILDDLQELGINIGAKINCDAKGNIYIQDNEQHIIYLLDSDGKLITSYSYQAEVDGDLLQSLRTDEGGQLFVCKREDMVDFICLDPTGGETKLFKGTDLENVFRWYGMNDSVLYYATNEKVIGWNVTTGEKKALLSFAENEITNALSTSLLVSEDGIQLISLEDSNRCIMTFTEKEPAKDGQMAFVNIGTNNSFLKGRIAAFSRENPLYATTYEDLSGEDEDISRILMEVVNGGGPDVLFVSREDVNNLQSNNALADLNQVLSKEIREALLTGVVEMGTYDNKLVGVPLYVNARTLLSNQVYWQENTWTINDVVAILEEQKDLEGIFLDMFGQDNYFYNMYYILGMDMKNTPFIQGDKANFDCPEFQDLLVQIKNKTNSTAGASSYSMLVEALNAGQYLGIEYLINNMEQFYSIYEKIGDNVCIVGYPTETGCGNYIQATGMLVVNQNAAEKEEVKALLNYLLSQESQQMLSSGISVRWDIPKAQEMDEYLNFLEHAVPYSIDSDELFNIIMEEAESYFDSDKTVTEVTRIIQSRVQLYLEEHQ